MKIRNLRWWIAGLLVVIAIKNYIDREMFSLLAPTIQAELHMDDRQYGRILNLFLTAYTVAYLLSGWLVDSIGARASMTLFISVWSISNAMMAFSRSVFSAGTWRFLFGLGEAGAFTAAPKVVSEWFPRKERGTAVSVYALGSSVGATIAPLVTTAVARAYGWRTAFFTIGGLGLVLIVPWLVLYRRREKHPWVTETETAMIAAGQGADLAVSSSASVRWQTVLSSPAIWTLAAARALTDPVWYFFQFWMPKYLHTVRGFGQTHLSSMWLIFLAADIGFLAGGYLSDRLIRRGQDARSSRLRVMLGSALLVPLAPLIVWMPSNAGVFAVAMLVVMAHTAWLTNIAAYVIDLVPKPVFATAFGVVSAGSAIGGILMNQAVAWTVTHASYNYCFYAMVAVHPLAWAILWRFARRLKVDPEPAVPLGLAHPIAAE